MSKYSTNIVKTKTTLGTGLPYSIVAHISPSEVVPNTRSTTARANIHTIVIKQFRKDLTERYSQKDISCHIDNYTCIATINFRNENDCADFLMRN